MLDERGNLLPVKKQVVESSVEVKIVAEEDARCYVAFLLKYARGIQAADEEVICETFVFGLQRVLGASRR